jgi:hypothetical protein
MNPSDSPHCSPQDDAWSLELALQVWGSDGGLVPDYDPAELPVNPALANITATSNPQRSNPEGASHDPSVCTVDQLRLIGFPAGPTVVGDRDLQSSVSSFEDDR